MAREWFSVINGRVANVQDLYRGHKSNGDEFTAKNFSVAVPFSSYNAKTKKYEDNTAEFVKVAVFGKRAEELDKAGLQKGAQVMVSGYMDREKPYTDRNGEEREGSLIIRADVVAVDPIFGDIVELRDRDATRGRGTKPASKPAAKKKPKATKAAKPGNDDFDDFDLDDFDDDDSF